MCPTLASVNVSDDSHTNSELLSDGPLRQCTIGKQLANVDDIFLSQPRTVDTCALELPVLAHPITSIVGIDTEEVMIRSDACGYITMMKDLLSLGDGAVVKLPREAMGENGLAVDVHVPVASFASSSGPQPAFAGLVDALPEAGFWSFSVKSEEGPVASLTAKPTSADLKTLAGDGELSATLFAGKGDDGATCGILGMHVEPPFDVPIPGLLTQVRGLFMPNYSTNQAGRV
jgi:hypothetical protein